MTQPMTWLSPVPSAIPANPSAPAQPAGADANNLAADAAWQALKAKLAPAPSSNNNGKGAVVRKTPAQIAADRAAAADRYAQASDQAKAFHTQYPKDANAGLARKLEVTSALESARLGRVSAEASALALAETFRKDKNQLREYRFEVALAAERLLMKKAGGEFSPHEKPLEHEKIADKLRKEFGETPEVMGLYASIAKSADLKTGHQIAAKVLEMSPPPIAKAMAQEVTMRQGMIGSPLRQRVKTVEGPALDLQDPPPAGATTVVCVWTPNPFAEAASYNPFSPLAAQKVRVKTAASIRWVYVGLSATVAQAVAVRGKAPFAGVHCIDPGAPGTPLVERIKAHGALTVIVLDGKGAITGIGQADELADLLATIR